MRDATHTLNKMKHAALIMTFSGLCVASCARDGHERVGGGATNVTLGKQRASMEPMKAESFFGSSTQVGQNVVYDRALGDGSDEAGPA